MEYVWKISGEQGEGIDSTGHIFAFNAFKNGYKVATYRKFSSRIKGGNTTFEVLFSTQQVFARRKKVDVLIALDEEAIVVSRDQIKNSTFIIFEEGMNIKELDNVDCIKIAIPLSAIAREVTGATISKNMVALGASLVLFEGMDYTYVMNQIEKRFSRKSAEMVEKNKKAFLEGFNFAKNFVISNSKKFFVLEKSSNDSEMLMTGNEAISLGALAAGCKYFAGYPITPASSIMEFMVKNISDFGGVVVQTEDEISAINSVIGASLAGVRAMTATSGPGFSLMAEAIGYAYATETPVVIANIQRGGPSTGLPTKTEDADILFSTFISHGDTEKIVLFPSDPFESFIYTVEAFNFAEKYQMPVILLSDLFLGENSFSIKSIDDSVLNNITIDRGKYIDKNDNGEVFYRYSFTDDGISYRIIPSVKGLQFQTSGNEHNEKGFIIENSTIRKKMVEKRMKKLANFNSYYFSYEDIGDNPKIAIASYGPSYHFAKEVCQKIYKQDGISFRILKLVVIYPFPITQFEEALKGIDKLLFLEQNYMGQLRRLYYMFGGKKDSELINKYDGEPFFFEDLYDIFRSKAYDFLKAKQLS